MQLNFNLDDVITNINVDNEDMNIPLATNREYINSLNLKQFYVYVHRRQTDKSIFYVGCGTGGRCLSNANRNSDWYKIVKECNYYIEIVVSDIEREKALSVEIQLIKRFGRVDNNSGILCNKTDGGIGATGSIMSDEEKQTRSINMTGELNHMYNKKFYGKDNPNYGNTGAKNPLSKAILAIDYKGNIVKEYPSIKSTENDGYSPTIVVQCCMNKRAQHMNMQFIYKQDYDENKSYIYKRGATSSRSVVRLNSMTEKFIEYYTSINDVAKQDFNPKNVQQVCKGSKRTHAGFIWKYFDELSTELQNQINELINNKDIV